MHRYLYILLFVVGILGGYSVASADVCNITVKCVCESHSLRVVPCPDFSNAAIDCTNEALPEGTCTVDCGKEVLASCKEIPIECKNNETANCLVTLPVEVHSGCRFDEINCSGQCVDISSDEANCGACGNSCSQFEECVSGTCTTITCPTGTVFCGPDAGCVDLSVDTSNCGGCGIQCNTPSEECVSGGCVPTCNPGLDYCLGAGCVDFSSDTNNCGGCGNECSAISICTDGTCIP